MRDDSCCQCTSNGIPLARVEDSVRWLPLSGGYQYGSDAWTLKPDLIAPVLNAYACASPNEDPILQEILTNIQAGKASDPNNANKNTPLVVTYHPPTDPKKTIHIDVFRMISYITIPHHKL